MFNEYDDLLNVEELCEILGIGKNTVYELLNSGELKAFKVGRRTWKISKIALERYIMEKSKISIQ